MNESVRERSTPPTVTVAGIQTIGTPVFNGEFPVRIAIKVKIEEQGVGLIAEGEVKAKVDYNGTFNVQIYDVDEDLRSHGEVACAPTRQAVVKWARDGITPINVSAIEPLSECRCLEVPGGMDTSACPACSAGPVDVRLCVEGRTFWAQLAYNDDYQISVCFNTYYTDENDQIDNRNHYDWHPIPEHLRVPPPLRAGVAAVLLAWEEKRH